MHTHNLQKINVKINFFFGLTETGFKPSSFLYEISHVTLLPCSKLILLEKHCISKFRYLSRTIWKTLANVTAQTPSLYVDSSKNDQHLNMYSIIFCAERRLGKIDQFNSCRTVPYCAVSCRK